MKLLEKIIFLSLSTIIIVSSIKIGLAFRFDDVDPTHPNSLSIEYLAKEGIIKGQSNSKNFDPNGVINRAEWATILIREFEINPSNQDYGFCFADIGDQWFASAVCYAEEQGWIKGYQAGDYAGKFMPANLLNTAEILVILSRVHEWTIFPGLYWYSGALSYAREANIIDASIRFDQALSRAQAAEILFRTLALEKYPTNIYDPLLGEILLSDSASPIDLSDNTQIIETNATVSISEYADLLVDATLPRGALYVPVLRFQLETDKIITLDALDIKSTSIGWTEDIAIARLIINGEIVKERPFSSDNMAHWINLNYLLVPNRPYIIETSIDFVKDARALGHYQFQFDPSAIYFLEENVDIQGDSISGQNFNIASVSIEDITISNPSKKLRIPDVESEGEIIGKFTIAAGTHDIVLRRIRLEDAGTTSSRDLKNFRLAAGSQELSYLANIDHSILDFFINDYVIEAGRDRTFTIRADILSPRISDTIRLFLDKPSDIYALDINYGFGLQVNNQFDNDSAWCVGGESTDCPVEGFEKRCSDEDIEYRVIDCVDYVIPSEPDEEIVCEDRLATVCGETTTGKQSFQNLCLAEQAGAVNIITGPCPTN